MIRVLITDDHPIVRRGLRQILEGAPDVDLLGEAANADELARELDRGPCDVVVLDISMPGVGGLEILQRLRRDYPAMGVLVLSIHPEEQYAVRCLRAGASGYLGKESAPESLVDAIRTVASGRRYLSPTLAEMLLEHAPLDGQRLPHETLSARETEVFLRLVKGETAGQIATSLEISPKTVSTYRSRLLEKMNMRTTAELTRYALDHDLLR